MSSRRASGRAVAIVLLLQVTASLLVNGVVFQGRTREALRSLRAATGGVVSPNLIANLVPLVLVVGLGVFTIAGQRPADVGWRTKSIPRAALWTLGLWIAMQVAAVCVAASTGTVRLGGVWTGGGAGHAIGALLGQILGNALAEETVFRGFLLAQFVYLARRRSSNSTAFVVGALASQAVFALLHLPNRLFLAEFDAASLAIDQVRLFVGGLLFVGVWFASRNLLVAVGVHAIGNEPVPLVGGTDGTYAAAWLGLVLIALAVVGIRSGLRGRAARAR